MAGNSHGTMLDPATYQQAWVNKVHPRSQIYSNIPTRFTSNTGFWEWMLCKSVSPALLADNDSIINLCCFQPHIPITISRSLFHNMLRYSVFHYLWCTEIKIWKTYIFVFRIILYKWCDLIPGAVSFPLGWNVVRIQFREISPHHYASLKTFWSLWNVRLVNDPGTRGIILNISRILTRNTMFSVTIKWVLDYLTSYFFKLLLCINQPPFKAFLTLCSI